MSSWTQVGVGDSSPQEAWIRVRCVGCLNNLVWLRDAIYCYGDFPSCSFDGTLANLSWKVKLLCINSHMLTFSWWNVVFQLDSPCLCALSSILPGGGRVCALLPSSVSWGQLHRRRTYIHARKAIKYTTTSTHDVLATLASFCCCTRSCCFSSCSTSTQWAKVTQQHIP